ncbi:hypothetical protein D9758_011356 [Tetrapyrgos nigripes]|uniref:Peptidase A1 domain-containing protein n=1 Tax=Tetrapyrgos nigripes TaxID=182062 RepID=A0A8H5G8E1_9AGAR|nr:hypothetical protein D9758_011356 [Tetrapyrgos nigripes]
MHSFSLLTSNLLLFFACSSLLIHDSSNFASASPVPDILASSGLKARKVPGGYSIPLQRTKRSSGRINDGRNSKSIGGNRKRGGIVAETGLGDHFDFQYTVPVEVGGTVTAVVLDTGSSDLWVTSDACTPTSCGGPPTTEQYPMSTFNDSGASVFIPYGSGSASGPVGFDTVTVAGISIQNQPFIAVNATDIAPQDTSGILGLSFPTLSSVQQELTSKSTLTESDDSILGTDQYGPVLARIAMTGALDTPMFAIQLQRTQIDIGGQGVLTVGTLPEGIDNSSLTWVPVKFYTDSEIGTQWEIDIDGVFLDGQRLADSAIPADGVSVTTTRALIDSGNSILLGPADVVDNILSTVSTTYNPSIGPDAAFPCDVPHTLTFQIGGKMFPVDPRDFISEKSTDLSTCLASTMFKASDPPSLGDLTSWSLGDPFFKSNLVAFYYGNLTHPSVDPPRIGFLSTVPQNANELLTSAIHDAESAGEVASTDDVAPTASAATADRITVSPGFSSPTATGPGGDTSKSDEGDPGNENGAIAGAKMGIGFVSVYIAVGMGMVAGW